MPKLTRRSFMKFTAASVAAAALADKTTVQANTLDGKQAFPLMTAGAASAYGLCHFCSVGCGLDIKVKDGKVISTEGFKDHPINEGALCPKGRSMKEIPNSDSRLTHPLVRKPGSDEWEPISWDDAFDKIVDKVVEVRDETFTKTDNIDGEDVTVNRLDGIFSLGSAEIDNEEAYLYTKFNRTLGVHNYSHQAEI
ncbi:molybdopterin-dependent oxidoreductase [Virgibacillus sp. NKC19-3]|nr:molybdopterin-dependent oxidoreductase [Virgibacillus sp. NKC19-3]